MAQFSPSNQTVQVTTGNVRTTVDFPNPTVAGSGLNLVGFPNPYPSPAFPNPLGSTFWDNAVTTANPNGTPTKYRYVRCVFTATPAIQAAPACVWYTDATMTSVTATLAESLTGTRSSFAGLIMPNSTDLSTLTTALLKANGGAAVWIAVAGIVTGVVSDATAAGDQLFASAVDWTTAGGFGATHIAAATATTGRRAATASAASPSTVYVEAESL